MKNLNKAFSITILLSFAFFISSCEKKANAQEEPEASRVEGGKSGQHSNHKKGDNHDHEMATRVKVSKSGTKFTPSVLPEELPDGAWACEMGGKVHYARMEKGDGKCAICNMKLSEHQGNRKKTQNKPIGE